MKTSNMLSRQTIEKALAEAGFELLHRRHGLWHAGRALAGAGVLVLGLGLALGAGAARADATAPCVDGAALASVECGTNSNTGTASQATAIESNTDATEAVDPAAVEDLKQTIAEQQLQISQQQQLLQMQSIMLDGLQQKVVDSHQKSLRRAARKPCGICRTGRRGLIRIHP